ncbi:AAA family ATPase [Glaesserella parasuis]|uniref:ATP-binding protein n=1 Tax=Glaesserella parasuis HPS10 TaxID=1450514 RepID=A0A837B1F4_GLAPU|nr:AAA family ATPase [Glaesserella parasuis]ATW44693.1 ATP-binding protein [Glaesserella parasuis str. Nagasaki]EQA01228.1 recF/RecN/SMC N terminal domain protein [Glaesserella parasuis str. Nagasaki]EYE71353.1 putative amino-acid ABC transporter ATP-binding protein [Glaesserella parasuis str. Nagasaki]KDB48317.1 ATP-binding protein [Glaesserella parasuis HPS10]MCT8541292.1 ATP-binding protein [Glaesserella parasuis]
MLKKLVLKNFTVFNEVDLNFSPHLNVIIGENGMGKSHILKLAYSLIACNASAFSVSKTQMQKNYADKLINVFRPESLGRLVRRKQGRERCEISAKFENDFYNCQFSFATSSKSEVQIDILPKSKIENNPVFLPTRELLTIYPNFVHTYNNHYLEYEETYYDTCLLLGNYLAKGPREERAKELLKPLEEAMGGKTVLDNGRFYLSIQGQGTMEIPLVAEGLRKLAMIARLIATGSLLGKGALFWDEPEANLNPKLIKTVAKIILQLCNNGIQIFIATHSLFLLRELEILSKRQEFAHLKQFYFGLKTIDNGIAVDQGDSINQLEVLTLLDEELEQSDRFLALVE